jgi:hypothetical protein
MRQHGKMRRRESETSAKLTVNGETNDSGRKRPFRYRESYSPATLQYGRVVENAA